MADFEMFSGDTKVIRVTATDENGAPLDLSGVDIIWALAKKAGGVPIFTKDIGNGISIVDAAAGIFEINLAPIDTDTLKGSFYHEAQMTVAPSLQS
jgi:hypothetical protein